MTLIIGFFAFIGLVWVGRIFFRGMKEEIEDKFDEKDTD